ncbi:metalloregulator ArsR/SmtB family transcription factor [Glycomyces luteolus]|uniref:Metalloregulator ArsR/SmtB family transcription factor n=1 Tax=Glycomyces luteolus TaxID=2670330 RepID=A0A9X3P807_9ACTN|nr:metalloregulator ArsR/SmtB family transcription factor [Glycomyces luteolus]MDA1358628.1 metalloregulator ArsR/SmtB family transcription factor [Glycomyces luteolus]
MATATHDPAPPAPDETTARFLKALASEARQRLMLQFAGGAELSVGEVAERLEIGQSTASQQLAQLKDGGLLTSRREAKTVYYRADKVRIGAALDRLRGFLDGCC